MAHSVMGQDHHFQLVLFFFRWQCLSLHLLNFHHPALVLGIFLVGDVLDRDTPYEHFTQLTITALYGWEILEEAIPEQGGIEECRQIAQMSAHNHESLVVEIVAVGV